MTRATHLFHLARLCNSPPPVVDAMSVGDFARLIISIRQWLEANPGG